MTDERPEGDWRTAERFNQGEAYSADAPTPKRARSLRPVILGGLAMLAATTVLALLGAGTILAFLGGVAVFLAVRYATAPSATEREIAAAPGVNAAEVAETLAAAEAELTKIDMAAGELASGAHRSALSEMTMAAREVLDVIAADPTDLRRARKFLKVYIPSARASVEKFAGFGVINDDALDAKFTTLIDDMIATCRRQRDTLKIDDKVDLEIEMDVLAERLARET